MILYSAPNPAPNPRRVLLYLAEKGLTVPVTNLSMYKREHKASEFLAKNGRGQLPTLELDDGTIISESISICRYFEALNPSPPMFGTTPLEIAHIDMWLRRVEMVLMTPVGAVWVHTHPLTAKLLTQFRDWGEDNRPRALDAMRWFDTQLAEKHYLAGENYSIADIVLLTTIDFAGFIGVPIPPECTHLIDWHSRVSARPNAVAVAAA
jgi:glutathione S-transferase